MILLLIVCLMKIINMTAVKSRRHDTKENIPRNVIYQSKGSKLYRGMTEHPYQKSWLPHYFPHTKRPLTTTNSVLNQIENEYNNYFTRTLNRNDGDGNCRDFVKQQQRLLNDRELTEENLKQNVQIVLNNINRNYNALKNFILNENVNNNTLKGSFNMISSPESDYNCNMGGGVGVPPLGCSIASSQDFSHDNSDYQWFLDYGYRDGVTHQSVLSSLSASYNGIGELSYYEDLAKNIDANLAEVDMESFRAEDIHSLLTTLPSLCSETSQRRKESLFDNSICKSEILFSPVKESHISVDSLDMGAYDGDGDIILTCQANKNNYTIAFEGSTVYSDDSYYDGPEFAAKLRQNCAMTNANSDPKKKPMNVSMTKSDAGLTTWSKLKKNSTLQLQRYPSGNNNTSINIVTHHSPTCAARRSSSMPNLRYSQNNQLNVSQAISNSSVDSYRKKNPTLPMCQLPISSCESVAGQSALQSSDISNGQVQNPPSFNLVKLFIKQKSHSSDTCMDVSSGCWPSDSSSSNEQKPRKKSMNDSGKGSALSRHDEDCETSFQYDSLDVAAQNDNMNQNKTHTNDLYREVFDSPVHRNYRECNLNIKNTKPFNLNNNDSIERDSQKETNRSSSDTSRTSDNVTQISNKTRIPLDMITRSIQTSQMLNKEKCKVLPASFLAQLNSLGETQKAPVYVIYPNYTLPNLDFINTKSEIILSPLEYKESFSTKKQRPYSCSGTEHLRKQEYSHIADWKSLVTLLPPEYYKMLKSNIPSDVRHGDFGSQRPLFCMTPPIKKSRTTVCDCASYTTNTSSESSSQPPSSGYRGSSTMLDDSEINNDSFERNEVVADRPPTGRTPRSILRRTNSGKSKRNSMFDDGSHPQKENFEKRRSVQDPYYLPEGHNIIETYIAEMNDMEIAQGYKNRLPNRSIPKTNHTTNPHELSELEINKAIHNRINLMNTTFNAADQSDVEARMRAENFLTSVPKSELKYYAEIANILESMDNNSEFYDRVKLKNEVSRALSKKCVSFKNGGGGEQHQVGGLLAPGGKLFNTPPNSPNISVARIETAKQQIDREKLEKINHNRFKRLQIQWELLSKDSQQLQRELETKSGGSTPTGGQQKSRIPRPVSYPASKPIVDQAKAMRSPSRIVPPKKYISPSAHATVTAVAAGNKENTSGSAPRTPSKVNTTPKRTRPVTRTR